MATIHFHGLSSCRNMAYASSTCSLPFLRMRLTFGSQVSRPKLLRYKNMQLNCNHWIVSASKKNAAKIEPDDISDEENINISLEKNKKPTRRGRKKSSKETEEEIIPVEATTELTTRHSRKKSTKETEEEIIPVEATTELTTRRSRKKSTKEPEEEIIPVKATDELTVDQVEKKPTRRGRKKSSKETKEEIIPVKATTELTVDQVEKTMEPVGPTEELQNETIYMRNLDPEIKPVASISHVKDDGESEAKNTRPKRGYNKKAKNRTDLMRHDTLTSEDEEEKEDLTNIEKTVSKYVIDEETGHVTEDDQDYGPDNSWLPLVICFGPAKVSFIPYARPADRVFEQEVHQAMPWLYWLPDTFFRAPGSDASSVAIALARLGGRVDFMGKVGLDKHGMAILSELKKNRVETRCTKMDDSTSTAVSRIKLTAVRHSLKAKCVGPSAEDSFLSSDINLDVLKEAKMLYFNSSALLDPKSKSTLMEVISIMKSQGSLIFFDVNLPLPLWHSPEEARSFLKESFSVSNFIELTIQELDFLNGIEQNVTENEDVNFVHRSREEVKEFWHDGLEVLFVTNGASGVSYYTKEHDKFFKGSEDIQIEPSSCEMSASGDALVAALVKSLVFDPVAATDPYYLEMNIRYAISSGQTAQIVVTGESGFYDDWDPYDDPYDQTVTTHEDTEDEEESYRDRVGELVA